MPPGGCESSSFCASSLFSCGNAPTETTIHYREPPPQIGRSFFFKAWSWPPFFLFIIVSFGGRSGNSSISRHQSTNEGDGIRGFSFFQLCLPSKGPKREQWSFIGSFCRIFTYMSISPLRDCAQIVTPFVRVGTDKEFRYLRTAVHRSIKVWAYGSGS